MTTDLVLPTTETGLSTDMADLAGLGTGRKFLPYVQLIAKSSKLVDKGVKPGAWVVAAGEKYEELGTSFDCIFIDLRLKAMHLKNNKPETINYEKKSAIFADIMARAETSKYGDEDSYMWGAEYLVWIPRANNGNGAFATYFMSSPTARSEADNINKTTGLISKDESGQIVRKPVKLTLTSKNIPKPKFSYYVPVATPCAAVFTANPTEEELKTVLTAFRNPPKDNREAAEEEARVR